MSDRKELLDEANELGLEFAPNIPSTKLQAMVAEAKGEPPALVEESVPDSPAVVVEEVKEESELKVTTAAPAINKPVLSRYAAKRKKISDARGEAMKTRIVTITNKDNRENDFMTTVYLSFENQYFGLSKVVPLDLPVELEESLIQIASSTMMTLHKDEIVDGKRTGNKVPVRTKKFAISYGRSVE